MEPALWHLDHRERGGTVIGKETLTFVSVPKKCVKCGKDLDYTGNVYEWKDELYCEYCFDDKLEKIKDECEYHGILIEEIME